MAFPVILVNSATGADTINTSGAGPSTAVTGTNASTDVAGTTVTVDAGTDISGIATDGSAAIFVNDTTTGHRRWSRITGSAGSGGATPTFTVSEAFTGSLGAKTWAVGGKRATIANSQSKLLFDNNGAAGDAMPGWIVEMQSGHTEIIGATFDIRRAGDTTNGPIILRGEAGAGTMPLITFSNNGTGFVIRAACTIQRDFEIRNSNATKTASIAIQSGSNTQCTWYGLKIVHATNKFWKAMLLGAGPTDNTIIGCEIANTASDGITFAVGSARHSVMFCYIHDCGGIGITVTSAPAALLLYGNIIARNTEGFKDSATGAGGHGLFIIQNTFDANTGDAIELTGGATDGQFLSLRIFNNIFSNNGGYALNITASVPFSANGILLACNDYYNNTSGSNPLGPISEEISAETLDPQYTDAANGNFSIGTNLKVLGYPIGGTTKIGYSPTYSYVDIGAAQRLETLVSGYLPVA